MLTLIHIYVIVSSQEVSTMETHENIKALREQLGLSQEDLARKVGYTDRSSIAKIEAGRVDLSQSKISAFAAALGVTPAQLMGISTFGEDFPDNIIPLPEMRKIPLIGSIACGAPTLAEEHIEEYIDIPKNIHADFALTCKGDSMINARIFDGDIVYIRQQDTVDNGQIAAVLIDGDATLKRVKLLADRIILEPENPLYDPLVYRGEEMNEVRILGKAVAFTSAVR